MKRILFCSPVQQSKELGGSKVVVELAEAMRETGWDCQIISPSDIAAPGDPDALTNFPGNLRQYLKRHAEEYDVVDYDHGYLPYPRSEFPSNPLFVARSVLLAHHLETARVPQPSGIRAALGRIVRGRSRERRQQRMVCRARATVQEADLVNVSNHADKAELMRQGIAPEKVVVLPYGISRTRRTLFDQVSSALPPQPVVAFVGTFDYRKGAQEFPQIVARLAEAVPHVRFKLLGTKGLFPNEAAVRSHFPKRLHPALEIMPTYQSEELPSLLASCSIGIFPSHLEGFGFGVLEMLAASVPVIAYDAPGPPMMLPAPYLVPRGDFSALVHRAAALLCDPAQLQAARHWAKERSQEFSWDQIARETQSIYMDRLSAPRTLHECVS